MQFIELKSDVIHIVVPLNNEVEVGVYWSDYRIMSSPKLPLFVRDPFKIWYIWCEDGFHICIFFIEIPKFKISAFFKFMTKT